MLAVGAGIFTPTFRAADRLPPSPEHSSANSLSSTNAPLVSVPLVLFSPLQAPLAEHVDACVDDHDIVTASP